MPGKHTSKICNKCGQYTSSFAPHGRSARARKMPVAIRLKLKEKGYCATCMASFLDTPEGKKFLEDAQATLPNKENVKDTLEAISKLCGEVRAFYGRKLLKELREAEEEIREWIK